MPSAGEHYSTPNADVVKENHLPIEGFIIRVLKVTGTCDAMLELLDASGELQLSHSKRSIQVPVTFTHSRMMRPCLPMRGF
jgi:hypothetical protein